MPIVAFAVVGLAGGVYAAVKHRQNEKLRNIADGRVEGEVCPGGRFCRHGAGGHSLPPGTCTVRGVGGTGTIAAGFVVGQQVVYDGAYSGTIVALDPRHRRARVQFRDGHADWVPISRVAPVGDPPHAAAAAEAGAGGHADHMHGSIIPASTFVPSPTAYGAAHPLGGRSSPVTAGHVGFGPTAFPVAPASATSSPHATMYSPMTGYGTPTDFAPFGSWTPAGYGPTPGCADGPAPPPTRYATLGAPAPGGSPPGTMYGGSAVGPRAQTECAPPVVAATEWRRV